MYRGRNFLIQRLVTVTPEVWETIAGGRSVSMSLNSETVDITTQQSAPWMTLLEDGGIRNMSLSISGVFNDDDSMRAMYEAVIDASIDTYQIISDANDTFTGKFQVTTVERSAEYNDSEQYSISLESSEEILYTPPSS